MSVPAPDQKPQRIVIIEWLDSWYEEEATRTQEELETEDTDCRRFTIGFVMAEGEKTIAVAAEIGDGGARHVTRIRKENIVSIKEIAST